MCGCVGLCGCARVCVCGCVGVCVYGRARRAIYAAAGDVYVAVPESDGVDGFT